MFECIERIGDKFHARFRILYLVHTRETGYGSDPDDGNDSYDNEEFYESEGFLCPKIMKNKNGDLATPTHLKLGLILYL